MQALLSVMMAGMNAILGLSNTIISILSFNYGMKNKERIKECIKYGIIDTLIVIFILSIIFEIFAKPLIISLLRLVIFVFPSNKKT